MLAEGEELSSNPLFCKINGLQTTWFLVDVAWRIAALVWLSVQMSSPRRPSGGAPGDFTCPDEEVPVWQVTDLSDDVCAAALAHAP
jgi:hypothetical protein